MGFASLYPTAYIAPKPSVKNLCQPWIIILGMGNYMKYPLNYMKYSVPFSPFQTDTDSSCFRASYN